MASKVTIYSTTEPGLHIERHQIDANECVRRGGWSFAPIEAALVAPAVIAPVVVEEVAAEPAPLSVPQKGKPGRKPKSA